MPSGVGEGDGELGIIRNPRDAALPFNIRSAAFVFPALPLPPKGEQRKGNPAISRQANSAPTLPLYSIWGRVAVCLSLSG